ncbi:MAG: glycosyltransferase family 2 protein [Bacteroidia bacterium]
MVNVAVVILNWNGRKFLEDFLPSVIQHNPDFSEIIVADNASTDDSLAWLNKNYPAVRVIRNSSNGGFAKGYNEVLAQVEADYFILLNSDVEVTKGWITPVIELMEKDHSIAAAQPKIRAFHAKEYFEYAGAAGGFIDKYGYPFCRGRIFETVEQDNGQYDDDAEIFWATGACMFVRASVWKEMGGLDEDFFAHMEEIDLCWRMRNRGYKIMYCGKSIVYHVGGGTLGKASPQKTYLNFRNNLMLLLKNKQGPFLFFKIFWRMCLDFIAGMKFLLAGEPAHFWAVQRGHFAFYARLPKIRKKRFALKKNIKTFATKGIYKKSIVAEYFLRGKKKFSDLGKENFCD